jgi:ribonuclease P protein component
VSSPPVGRIRRRTTFGALRHPAGRSARGPLRVAFVPPPSAEGSKFAQVAYAIDRRCGGAVERNRLRRRLRAAVGHVADELEPGAYLVRTEPAAAELGPAELASTVCAAMTAAARQAGDRATERGGDRR